MAKQPATKPSRRRKQPVLEALHFERRNLYLMLGGLFTIVVGYVLLRMGSITLAPILLVVGYCILIPVSLVWRSRSAGVEPPGTRPRETTPRS